MTDLADSDLVHSELALHIIVAPHVAQRIADTEGLVENQRSGALSISDAKRLVLNHRFYHHGQIKLSINEQRTVRFHPGDDCVLVELAFEISEANLECVLNRTFTTSHRGIVAPPVAAELCRHATNLIAWST